MLDESVGGYGRAVPEIADVLWLGLNPPNPFLEALGNATRRIVRRGRDFPHFETAGRLLEQADICEGPP